MNREQTNQHKLGYISLPGRLGDEAREETDYWARGCTREERQVDRGRNPGWRERMPRAFMAHTAILG